MEWISVKDKMPDENKTVLIIRQMRNGEYFLPDIACVLDGKFAPHEPLPEDTEFNGNWITHWMPLPKPPKTV